MNALLETNAIIGSYRVLRPLGRGGMGEVYEVEHVRLGTRYALKAFALERRVEMRDENAKGVGSDWGAGGLRAVTGMGTSVAEWERGIGAADW